ncbi:hypothetical protein ABGN05_20330 [Aquibium sp. LZ166]|uniref:Uncharacterized protein n=1 Tax=Aquibium pacificus TaxID=3153579 RepID=A0ABV3SNY0_9HYPH
MISFDEALRVFGNVATERADQRPVSEFLRLQREQAEKGARVMSEAFGDGWERGLVQVPDHE